MDKFKVGDKVKLITDNTQCKHGFNKGDICKIVNICTNNRYPIEINNSRVAGYASEDELELIEKLTKTKLLAMPAGTKIITDAEDEDYRTWIKIDEDTFVSNYNTCYEIDEYEINDDLTLDSDSDFGTRIVKVEEPDYKEVYNYTNEAREMTVAEIEKELGYSIKVVREEN